MRPYDKNKYFFIELPESAIDSILTHCVSKTKEGSAKLYDGSYLVKLPMDIKKPKVLSKYTAYTHAQMKVEKAIREQDRPEL